MKGRLLRSSIVVCLVAIVTASVLQGQPQERPADSTARSSGYDRQIQDYAAQMLKEGRQIFRFDTFGSEDFWGGKLGLHKAIAGEKLGGVGQGVSPKAALALGLKVD